MSPQQQIRLVEAILFASATPVSPAALRARLPEDADLGAIMEALAVRYTDAGVELARVGEDWALRTAPDLAPYLEFTEHVARKLSRAAVETLAIIAYSQPVTRAEIEDVRGVAVSKGTIDTLLEAGWVRPVGRKRAPGRPVTWGTAPAFLDHFGLASLDDLPGIDELKKAGLLDTAPGLAGYMEQAADRDGSDDSGAAEADGEPGGLPQADAEDEFADLDVPDMAEDGPDTR